MTGETDLATLLRTMTADMADGVFVFATFADSTPPADLNPIMMFQEREGTTLILRRDEAEAHGVAYEFPCRMITLNVHSALDAVGFIARIASELAAAGMGVNPVAGFFHDHLFIPDGREDEAMRILADIAESG